MKKCLSVLVLVSLYACGGSSNSSDAPVNPLPAFAELSTGNYTMPCFFNKLASQGNGQDIYTKATLNLNADATGTNDFELYDDAACTNLMLSGTVAIVHYETVTVGESPVLMMIQNDGNGEMQIWIPYAQVGTNYFIDVDFTDGESGPYTALPTEQEIAEFVTSPETEGLQLQKI